MTKEKYLNFILITYLIFIFVFIFTPIAFSVIFSFNSQRFPTIPLGNFSLEWYIKIFNDPGVWQAAINSVIVSLVTCILATFLGFCTAYSDYRYRFKFKGLYL